MEIKVSVIIPVYNTEKYLEKCLDSVLKQTLEKIEIIAINDGSKDSSKDILEKYSIFEKFRIINKKNEGASKTRNLGINLAKGKFIYFMDADDYIEKNMLLEMYDKAEKDNLDIVVCDYYNEDFKTRKYVKNLDIKENEIISGVEYARYLLQSEKKIVPSIWGKMIRRSIYINNNIRFPENIFIGEDTVLGIKTAYFSKKVGKINKPFYHYIIHEAQGTKIIDKEKEFLDKWNGIKEIEIFLKNKPDFEDFKEGIEKNRIVFYLQIFKQLKYIKYLNKEWLEKIEETVNYNYYKKMKFYKKMKYYFEVKKIRNLRRDMDGKIG
ncbi:glycosyltransferase [Fusobacterium varium]|jgi:glycosyltransferase involved in cell wall biosynthesis